MGAYFLVVVHGLLIVVASRIAEHQLKGTRASVAAAHGLSSCSFWDLEHGLNTCGAQAYLLHGMWDLPGPGIEPVSLHWKANSLPLSHQGNPRLSFEESLLMDGDKVERPFQKGKKV